MGLHRLILVVALGVAGCSAHTAAKPKTTATVLAPIAGHKTYAFDAAAPAPPGYAQTASTQAHIAKVKEQVDAAMQAKGYTLSPTPHLVVRISIGLKSVKDPTAVKGATVNEIDQEHHLAIDMVEYASGNPVFKGTATSLLQHRPPEESKIADAVPSILESVPPAS